MIVGLSSAVVFSLEVLFWLFVLDHRERNLATAELHCKNKVS